MKLSALSALSALVVNKIFHKALGIKLFCFYLSLFNRYSLMTQTGINQIAYKIVGAAIEVHKHLGPGLLESVYHSCLKDELFKLGFKVQSQLWIPVHYKGKALGGQLKLDLLVENLIIMELKAVDVMIPLYTAQLLSYLKLASKPKGLLINFHSENITKQLVPVVTEEFARLPK